MIVSFVQCALCIILLLLVSLSFPSPAMSSESPGNDVQEVGSINELRALPPPAMGVRHIVDVRWYSAPGDGGGGSFVWSVTSSAPDDGGLVISSAKRSNDGRWLRIMEEPGVVSPLFFGARCNGSRDDSDGINRAIASLRRSVGLGDMERYVGILRLPARPCSVMTTINSTGLSAASVMIEGTGEACFAEPMASLASMPWIPHACLSEISPSMETREKCRA